MASIAVSLSGGGGGGRRAGSSTGVSTTLNHHVNNGSSSVKSGSSPSTDTLRSSSKQSVISNNSNNKQQPIIRQQQHSEIDLLRKIIQDKDALIQTWISPLLHFTLLSFSDGNEWLRMAFVVQVHCISFPNFSFPRALAD